MTDQVFVARIIGEQHARDGAAPWDMQDVRVTESALLMDAVGETGPTTEANHAHRLAVASAYDEGYASVPLTAGEREHLERCRYFPCETCDAYARRCQS